MKKMMRYLLFLALILSTLACRMPFVSRIFNPPVVGNEGSAYDEPAPLAEQPTAAAQEQDLSGQLQVYSDNGVEITLPGSFVLGDVEKDLSVLLEGVQVLSEETAQDIQALYEQNEQDIMLWGYDTDSPGEHTTSLLILKNEEFAGESLPMISVFANALLGEEVGSIDQEQLSLGEREVLRFLTSAEMSGVETAQAVYLFNEADKLWVIGFFTSQAQIGRRLSSFDAAVASFEYLGVE